MAFTGSVTAVLGKDLAHDLGKKGTVSDVTLYNHKQGETVLAFVEPTGYPDKVQSLITALSMSDQVIFKVTELNSHFAETLVALDAAGMKTGYLILGPNVQADSLKKLFAGTPVENYPVVQEQVVPVRERLAEYKTDSSGDVVLQIDHSFAVKGVGTVALGVVKKGILRRHDEMTIYPNHMKALVKSIQVSDVDMEEAGVGVRVGIAVKNLRPDEIDRGSVLSKKDVRTSDTFELNAALSRYSPRALEVGDVFLAASAVNYAPATVVDGSVTPGSKGKIKIKLDKPVPVISDRILFLDPGLKMPRIFGYGLV
jgi:selenocysteine-specific translation elongation factor